MSSIEGVDAYLYDAYDDYFSGLQPSHFLAKAYVSLVESLAYVNDGCKALSMGWKRVGITHRNYHLLHILLSHLFVGLVKTNSWKVQLV